MMDELGSCRAVSLAALARHAAAESGWCLGICADRSTAKASAALDFMVGDADRRVSDGDGGGGLSTGDLERLIGISSRDDAPPGLNGLQRAPLRIRR